MQRHTHAPREDWETKVEEVGLRHHTAGGVPYWHEEAHYTFRLDQVYRIENATRELHRMCIEAAEAVIRAKRYAELAIPACAVPLIEQSWEADAPSLYGRFDLSYDGTGEPRMLEYNADTPTSLVEAAVAQWFWLEERYPGGDQFNRLHEALVETWTELKPHLLDATVHFAAHRGPGGRGHRRLPARHGGAGGAAHRAAAGAGHRLGRRARSWTWTARRSAASSSCTRGSGWWTRSSASTWCARRGASSGWSPRGR